MSKQSDYMNGIFLAAAGRTPDDELKEKKPTEMNRLLLGNIPKSIKLFKKVEE